MPIELHHAPPVHLVVFDGQTDPEEFRAYLDAMASWLEGEAVPGIILDASRSGIPPKWQREMQGAWMKEFF